MPVPPARDDRCRQVAARAAAMRLAGPRLAPAARRLFPLRACDPPMQSGDESRQGLRPSGSAPGTNSLQATPGMAEPCGSSLLFRNAIQLFEGYAYVIPHLMTCALGIAAAQRLV